ncbi:hypothetical protein K2173_018511 [Erythroxylum novogranatense]|uniref:SAM domain-containing protein n=1 Tax=Erythroxylum novogranatense TaxID=1862640 RepID=A0AAV8UE28_9ROSI|nr:hypothetical protein K2173_018511 [Erythroxylum novogranatense]
MYADRVEAASRKSIKERLNVNSIDHSIRSRLVTGKRQRQDDKWEHDLFDNDGPRLSNRKVGPQDLRQKLQRKSLQQSSPGVNWPVSGVRDLREKLSGIMNSQAVNADPSKGKPEAAKATKKNVAAETPRPEIKKSVGMTSTKKSQQKADTSVDSFLQSLGLEKYLITFRAEEVDMTALIHMSDEDLKAIGIPMGPRKKILLALESKG